MKNVNFKISDSTKKFLFAVALTFCDDSAESVPCVAL